MDALQMLRALALSYAPTADYPVCLDREKRLEILALRQQAVAVKAKLDGLDASDDEGATIGEEPAADRLTRELSDLEDRIAEAEEGAKDQSVVLIFKRLPATPDSADEGEVAYSTIEAQHTDDKGAVDYEAMAADLLRVCYLRTESVHGDLDLSWREASRLVDDSDMQNLRNLIVGHHRLGARIPFDPRSSGQPETT